MRDARRERRAERRRRQAERQAERRRAAGAQPRAVYEGRSAERIKPWTIDGVSRRTWYRRRLPIQPQSIRLTQLDGKLPNLALMKLAYHHRQRGDEIYFTKHVERGLWEPDYQRVYGSAIFSYSAERVAANISLKRLSAAPTTCSTTRPSRRRSGSTRAKSMTIDLSEVRRLDRLHAAWLPVAVRLLRRATKGRSAALCQHGRIHLAGRAVPAPSAFARQ